MHNINSSFYLSIATLFYVILTFFVYLFKDKNKNIENKLYVFLLVITFLSLISEFMLAFIYKNPILLELFMKLFLLCCLSWIIVLLLYLISLLYSNGIDSNIKKIMLFFYLVSIVAIAVLPVDYHYLDGVLQYSTGPSVTYAFSAGGFVLLIILILYLLNRKNIILKKRVPIVLFTVLIIVAVVIQRFYPSCLLINFVLGLTVSLMYFTIENPDAKIAKLEQESKENAIKASEAKTDFLSSMSHELRTPLNAIIGLSEDISSYSNSLPKDVSDDCNDIINASDILLEIIGNILDISKIESGRLEIVESDYSPKDEFESLVKTLRVKISEKPIDFEISISDSIPKVLFGDRLRIKQIINNLISNAIKYTDKGKITFNADWDGKNLIIKVSDTGHGIRKEDLDKLFSKYNRLQVEKISSVQGTGLGLSITKNLVELMGGKLFVNSVYGDGSIFDAVIPQKIGNDMFLTQNKNVIQNSNIDFSNKNILVVDDNILNLKVLRKVVKNLNFRTIDEALNGQEAINKINAGNKYDLILLDIMMPIMGGEETLNKLKEIKGFNTPVIALTADAMSGARDKYLSMGFNDYLSKPFTRQMVIDKIVSCIMTNNSLYDDSTLKILHDSNNNIKNDNVLYKEEYSKVVSNDENVTTTSINYIVREEDTNK